MANNMVRSNSEIIIIKIEIMRTGAKTSTNANLVWIFYEKQKRNFYKALDEKQVSDSKTFWKNVNLFYPRALIHQK